MSFGIYKTREPVNEPVLTYAPGSLEKKLLKAEIDRQLSETIDIPVIIGGKEIRTGKTINAVCPHDHQHILGVSHQAGQEEIEAAIINSLEAKKEWERMSFEDRAAIFLKMADLISGKYRYILNAATMLNQSKNPFQAEIDASCELADFLRFNVKFMEEIYSRQPESGKAIWNKMEYRPLEGFVFAVTPFNFTAIAGNLVTAPAMMGNSVLWKPASTALFSGYKLMELYKEAGLPDGVINFVPSSGSTIGELAFKHKSFAGLHFTGSTGVFSSIWSKIGRNIKTYTSYPRIVGETGGKDYILMHQSADAKETAVALLRGSFEYQGQKCSACSRAYIPASRWEEVQNELLPMIKAIPMGDVNDFRNFCNAVISEKSFDNAMKYISDAVDSPDAEIIIGGKGDKSKGYFIEPTIIKANKIDYVSMKEEIFAPVLSIYVYDDADFDKVVDDIETNSAYALTGGIFARGRKTIGELCEALRNSAGNFYINDKPTGAVVGQQPFGGARASGTNDKAGSYLNLIRWTSVRTIKENFNTDTTWQYPFMDEK